MPTAKPNVSESDMQISLDQTENDLYALSFDLSIHTVVCLWHTGIHRFREFVMCSLLTYNDTG